ncbi:serine/arginine repetitive matrix protein 1 [Ixodes scapularis]
MIPHSSRDTNPTVTAVMDEDADMDIYEDLHDRDPSSAIEPKRDFSDIEDTPELDLLDTSVIPRLKTPQKKQCVQARPPAAESIRGGISALLSAGDATKATSQTNETAVAGPAKPQSTLSKPIDVTAWAALKKENAVLKHNISILYRTAKYLLQSKDKEISNLRQKLDNLIFRRNQGGTDRLNGFREPPPPLPLARPDPEKASPRQPPQGHAKHPTAKQAPEKPKADLSEDLQRLYKYRKVKSSDRTEYSNVEPLDVPTREAKPQERRVRPIKSTPKDIKGPRRPVPDIRRRPIRKTIDRVRPAHALKEAAANRRGHKRGRPASAERRRYLAELPSPREKRWDSPAGRREDAQSPYNKRYRAARSRSHSKSRSPHHGGRKQPSNGSRSRSRSYTPPLDVRRQPSHGPRSRSRSYTPPHDVWRQPRHRSRSRSRSYTPPRDGRKQSSHGHGSRHRRRSRKELLGTASPDYGECVGAWPSKSPSTLPPHFSDESPPHTPYAGRQRSRYSRSPQHLTPPAGGSVERASISQHPPVVHPDARSRIRKSRKLLSDSHVVRTADSQHTSAVQRDARRLLRKSHKIGCLPQTLDGGSSFLARASKKASVKRSPRKVVRRSVAKTVSSVPKNNAVHKEGDAGFKMEPVAEAGERSIPVPP